MYRACIAVVDASRARLFTYERSVDVEGISEELTEERDLVNPARRLRASELFSDSRPGSSRTGALQYGLDDHRDAHVDKLDADFSRSIVEELQALVETNHPRKLIVCASPSMLGALREARDGLGDIEIDELPRDLVRLTPPQLREHLASYGLLPAKAPRERD
jgi:protein required for attachment to host cells